MVTQWHGRFSVLAVKDTEPSPVLRDIQEELTQMLEEVRKNGFDAYCAD